MNTNVVVANKYGYEGYLFQGYLGVQRRHICVRVGIAIFVMQFHSERGFLANNPR